MITFDPNVGFSVSSTSEIREAIVNDWTAIFDDETATLNTESESPAGQIIDSLAVLVTAKDSEFLNLANQFNPLTADGIFQDAIGSIYFLTRKTNTSTVVSCVCTGLRGTLIPAGSVIQTEDGIKLSSVNSETIGDDGKVAVEFAAQEPGAIDIGANTCTKIITVIAGWDTVTNPTAGIPGRLVESRMDFENRRYNSVAKNSHGSRLSLQGAIYDVPGVLDCLVLENRTNETVEKQGVSLISHSVGICVYGGSEDDIAETIYNKLDAGCGTNGETEVTFVSEDKAINTYKIVRPTVVPIYVEVTIVRTPNMKATVEEDVKSAIINDANGLDFTSENVKIGMGQTIYSTRFTVAVVKTAGVPQLQSITIGRAIHPTGNFVTLNANEEPVISADTIEVVIISAD